ncbi:MAG: PA2778 family cysteine peptidase [Bacteroidales bacterium]
MTGTGDSGKVRVAGVPFHPQEGFQCGPAPMAMVLNWSGLEIKPAMLEQQPFSERADPRRILADTASHYGRLAYPIAGTSAMMTELAAGHPVLVVQNLGVESRPLWNCVVAIGYDRTQEEVVVHSGEHAGKRMSLRLFERLWSDSGNWGLVVLKPGDLPAAAHEPDYLKAAYNLRRAGRYWEAVQAYDAALATWPTDAEALMGLGASLYLLGDTHGATDAYRTALLTAPDPLPAQAALEQIAAETPHARPPFLRPQPRPASGRRVPPPAVD